MQSIVGRLGQEKELELGLEECADFKQGKQKGMGKRRGSNARKRQRSRNVDICSGQGELQVCRGRILPRPCNKHG